MPARVAASLRQRLRSMRFTRRAALGLPLAVAELAAPALARLPGGAMGRILARGRLRAGVWLDGGPYGHRAADGRPGGMEVEVARDIARALGVTLELVPIGASDRVPAVALGYVDIACAAVIITAERLRRIAFAHPHGVITTVLVTTSPRPAIVPGGLPPGAVLGREGVIAGLAGLLPRENDNVVVEDYEEALAWLRAGRAVALALPETAFRRLALQHPEAELHVLRVLSEQPYAVALPLGEPDLQRFLNAWVFLREDDGTLAQWHEAFFSSPRPNLPRL